MSGVAVLKSGMVTGVGLTAESTCAAIRCGIAGFEETRFMYDGEWLLGCEVPLEQPWRGREKLLRMAVPAIRECLDGAGSASPGEIPLLLCVAEEDRPGRLDGLDDSLIRDIEERLGVRFHGWSRIMANGRIAGVQALDYSRRLLAEGLPFCIVAGVDSYLVAGMLDAYHRARRLLTADNSDGFIPGEGAAAVLVGHTSAATRTSCLGFGYGAEPAPLDSGEPLRAEGLVQAVRAALADAAMDLGQLDYRITDLSGEQFGFKEAALALLRVLRERKEEYDLQHPADCVGQIGAAAVPLIVGVARDMGEAGLAPGPGALVHAAGDGAERAALVMRSSGG